MTTRRSGLALFACIAVLAGCGGSSSETTPPPPDKQANNSDKQVAKLQAQVRALRKANREQAGTTGKKGLPPPASAKTQDTGDFSSFASGLDGTVGVAIGSPGSATPVVAGDLTTGSAWSTSKVPIALRLLQERGDPSKLSSAEVDEMNRAITLSDNDAAAALFAQLEQSDGGLDGASKAVQDVLREAGDSETQISTVGRDGFSTYGQTDWSLANQARFMEGLAGGCVGTAANRNYVLGLMGKVTSDSWGLGSIPAQAWKGGWGPDLQGRYLLRQMGVLDSGGKKLVVVLAAMPSDGSFETGQGLATQVAGWLSQNAAKLAPAEVPC